MTAKLPDAHLLSVNISNGSAPLQLGSKAEAIQADLGRAALGGADGRRCLSLLVGRFMVCIVAHGLQPLVGGLLARNLQREMREPAVGRGAVPVLHPGAMLTTSPGRSSCAGFPTPGKTLDQPRRRGSAHRRFGVMDAQLLRQPGSKRHVVDTDSLGGKGREVALPDKVLREGVVGGNRWGKTISFWCWSLRRRHTSAAQTSFFAMRKAAHALGQPA